MYLVAWSAFDDEEQIVDNFEVWDTLEEANLRFAFLQDDESMWCAAVTKIVDATEPHWMDDDLGPSNNDEGE